MQNRAFPFVACVRICNLFLQKKLQECLIQATAEMANVEAGYPVDKNSGTPMDSAFENVLCKLSSMLENCLFHMVDWVNRTEIFGILPVGLFHTF